MSKDPVMDKIIIIWIVLMAIFWILFFVFYIVEYLLIAFLITLIGIIVVGYIRSYREQRM